jgi:NAD-dependent dihydropyrimidine dehydrogenase PreA subunit
MITEMRPYISEELCEKCGDCVALCPYDVFETETSSIIVAHPEDCIECTACAENCPHNAISLNSF